MTQKRRFMETGDDVLSAGVAVEIKDNSTVESVTPETKDNDSEEKKVVETEQPAE